MKMLTLLFAAGVVIALGGRVHAQENLKIGYSRMTPRSSCFSNATATHLEAKRLKWSGATRLGQIQKWPSDWCRSL